MSPLFNFRGPSLLVCAALCVAACTAPVPAADKPAPKVDPLVKAETPPTPPPAAATPVKVEIPPPTPPPLVPAPDALIGLTACDDYVTRYRTCIADFTPAIDKERHTKVLDAQRANWLAASADPKLAPALADECSAAFEATRDATRIWGCVWRPDDKPTPEVYPKGETTKKVKARGIDPFE